MANLIDYTYFIRELSLPQAANVEGRAVINSFIDKYEPKLLTAALGADLYAALVAGLAEETPLAIWTDLMTGKDYIYNLKSYRWTGLRNTTTKESPIANYVYYWIMKNNISNTTGIGEVSPKGENSFRANPSRKMTAAWNEMVDQLRSLKHFLDSSVSYPDWVLYEYPYNDFRYQQYIF